MTLLMKRREFLTLLGGLAASSVLQPIDALAQEAFVPDVEIMLTAREDQVAIFSGAKTDVYRYTGKVLKGDATNLSNIEGSYLGPILRLQSGQKLRVIFNNELPEASIIHWHGMFAPEKMDGHPMYAIGPQQQFVYEFVVTNRAGTYRFHPHPHQRTGQQVMMGLAGLLIVSDKEEQALSLPGGEYDLPIVIQDRSYSDDNQFLYVAQGGMMGMMQRMMGFLGDQIMVNGKPNYKLSIASGAYRLRLLNGSNSRIYKLAWSNGMPMQVIASDGGLLPEPVQRDYLMLAPGERYDLWVDFSTVKPGSEMYLKHLPIQGPTGHGGMMRGGMSLSELPMDEEFNILQVSVNKTVGNKAVLPKRLSTVQKYRQQDAKVQRIFNLTMQHMKPGINNRSFDMLEVADDEVVKFNDLELWEFRNDGMNGMMTGHPMHLHNVQYQIIERSVHKNYEQSWNSVKDGYVDSGWKDTVLLMPGERAKILVKFDNYKGLYLYHCHNLEHAALGMMRNYLVK